MGEMRDDVFMRDEPHVEICVGPLWSELARYAEEVLGLPGDGLEEQMRGYVSHLQQQLSGQVGYIYGWDDDALEQSLGISVPATNFAAFRLFVSWVSAGKDVNGFRAGMALADPHVGAAKTPAGDDRDPGAQCRQMGAASVTVFLPGLPSIIGTAPLFEGGELSIAFGSLPGLQEEINELANALGLWIPPTTLTDQKLDPIARVAKATNRADAERAMMMGVLETLAVASLDASRFICPLLIMSAPAVIENLGAYSSDVPTRAAMILDDDAGRPSKYGYSSTDESFAGYTPPADGPTVLATPGPLLGTMTEYAEVELGVRDPDIDVRIRAYLKRVQTTLTTLSGRAITWREELSEDEVVMRVGGSAEYYACFGFFLGWIATGRQAGAFLRSAAMALPEVRAVASGGPEGPFAQCFLTSSAPLVAYVPDLPAMQTSISLQVGRGIDVHYGSLPSLISELQSVGNALGMPQGLPDGTGEPGYDPFVSVQVVSSQAEAEQEMIKGVYHHLLHGATVAWQGGWPLVLALRR